MKNNLKHAAFYINPLYWPIWIFFGLLWTITRLPHAWQLAAGKGMGRLLACFPSPLKKITLTNLTLCFPEQTPAQRNALLHKNFESLGIGMIETAIAWWLPDAQLKSMYQIHGLEHAEKAYAKGKGIILLGPHTTCLEIIGRMVGMHNDFAVMYRPHKKRFISFLHDTFRKRHYVNYVPSHRVRQLLRVLENNQAIWYAYDIDAGRKNSVFAPFFGIPTASMTALSRMITLSDATIIPVHYARREGKLFYDVVLSPPLQSFPTGDFVQDATLLNHVIEKNVRANPDQYIWQYKRFKTRPPGDARFY